MKKAYEILKKHWGFDSFLPNQKQIIDSILSGQDTVALIPTGGGKSMCYQIPALLFEGTCLVISPLIALISDQVQRLKSLNIKANGLHSGLNKSEVENILTNLRSGEIKLLYISPEKLQSKSFKSIIKDINISFIAVDEAHCISQWGYDFRPDYRRINDIKIIFPDIQIAAFTATANNKTLKDIKQYLSLNKSKVIRGSFIKKNITFAVIQTEKKLKILKNLLKQLKGSGIVYMRSRKGTVLLNQLLNQSDFNSDYYHAWMNPFERKKVQYDWLIDKTRIIISTTAFGMGIDKSNVRFVIHYDLPGSMEEYYQEAGRAGRDGQKSDAIIIYNQNDLNKLYQKSIVNFPSISEIKNTFFNLIKYFDLNKNIDRIITLPFKIDEFYSFNKISNIKTYNCIVELERYNAIELNIPLSKKNSILKLNFKPEILNSKDVLNDIELQLIKKTLLIYENLFIIDTKIDEDAISKESGVSKNKVIKVLNQLRQKKLIIYNNQNQNIEITFKNIKQLKINESEINFRKKRLINNIHFIEKHLANHKTCRQKIIVNYFDEKLKKNCKICDICLDVNNDTFSKKEFSEFSIKIDNFQFDNNTDIDDLIFIDCYLNRNKNFKIIKTLIQGNKLSVIGDRIIRTV